MRNPHVRALYYKVSSDGVITYKEPDALRVSHALADFTIDDGSLTVRPKEYFGSEEEARSAIEPFLRAWEMHEDLISNIGTIRFKFDQADVVDREPPRSGEARFIGEPAVSKTVSVNGTLTVQWSRYPAPPSDFSVTPDVELVYCRWLRFKEGKEPLQSMAYFVLTVLERAAGGRKQAATTYQLEKEILEKIGKLSSTRGDGHTARKADATLMKLSPNEYTWLAEAIRQVIRRMGEHAAGRQGGKLALADLPTLRNT
ncbi:hypothetical protein [Kineobactrum salinum]|uniref:Uncharacterized protein n=1 Tax=Kineobactrum salinum TaxID=2708301 RepID=A0A6C0U3P2_9GAMM|nr:hypothetical protein [Kineobactrum salinum]QIB66711.1 hypothetical protein G3T16_16230 [Kineobactrum salinum]